MISGCTSTTNTEKKVEVESIVVDELEDEEYITHSVKDSYQSFYKGIIGTQSAALCLRKYGGSLLRGSFYNIDDSEPHILDGEIKYFYENNSSHLEREPWGEQYDLSDINKNETDALKKGAKFQVLRLEQTEQYFKQNPNHKRTEFIGRFVQDSLYEGYLYRGNDTIPFRFLIEKDDDFLKTQLIERNYTISEDGNISVSNSDKYNAYISLEHIESTRDSLKFISKEIEKLMLYDSSMNELTFKTIDKAKNKYLNFGFAPSVTEKKFTWGRIRDAIVIYRSNNFIGFLMSDVLSNGRNRTNTKYSLHCFDLVNKKKITYLDVFKPNTQSDILSSLQKKYGQSYLENVKYLSYYDFITTQKGIYFCYDSRLGWGAPSAGYFPEQVFLSYNEVKNIMNPTFKIDFIQD